MPAIRHGNKVTVCMGCGNAMVYDFSSLTARCIGCGRLVQVYDVSTWKQMKGVTKGWFSTIEAVDGIQLLRTFEIRQKFHLKGHAPESKIWELCRHWLLDDGTIRVTSTPRFMGHFFPGRFRLVRQDRTAVHDYIADHAIIYPDIRLTKPFATNLTYDILVSLGALSAMRAQIRMNTE